MPSRAARTAPEPLPPGRPLRQRVGGAGEAAALKHLEQLGWRVVARDWRCRVGQIDIVAEDGDTLVLVEVKARRGGDFGTPQEAVDLRKQHKLRVLLEAYRGATHRHHQPCRIDVLALRLDGRLGVERIEHIRSAVEGD